MLYIVGVPVDNLEDVSIRALRVLGEVDFVLCEDTRAIHQLLDHYDIKTPTILFHQHCGEGKIREILDILKENKSLALISGAGTPGLSDLGGKLISRVFKEFGERIEIESVPGPSVVTAALSISGIPIDKFVFMGFPPHDNGREDFMKKILESEYPVVVYESKEGILKFLKELKNIKVDDKVKENVVKKKENLELVVVCREFSKMHETVYRGNLSDIIEKISLIPKDQEGEFVVIIS